MTRLQHYLLKLAEECSETAQRASKSIQFGLMEVEPNQPDSNLKRLHSEINDILAIVDILNTDFNFNYEIDFDHIKNKREKIEKYLAYSVELGCVSVDTAPDLTDSELTPL